MSTVIMKRIADPTHNRPQVFDEIQQRYDEIQNRAFELFETRGKQRGRELDDWITAEHEILGRWPAAQLTEDKGKYNLEMTLPGYQPSEVEVTATPTEIIVHATTDFRHRESAQVLWTEFGSNEVIRKFDLPERINVERANASLENGILRIAADKAAPKVGMRA